MLPEPAEITPPSLSQSAINQSITLNSLALAVCVHQPGIKMITTPPEEVDNPFRTETSSASPSTSRVIDTTDHSDHTNTTTQDTPEPEPTTGPLDDIADPDPPNGLPPPSYKTSDGRFHAPVQSPSTSPTLTQPEPARKRAPSIEVLPRDIIQVSYVPAVARCGTRVWSGVAGELKPALGGVRAHSLATQQFTLA